MASNFNLTDASVAALFKQKYEKISENMYNGSNPFLSRVKKSYDAVGATVERAVPMGFQGGVGSGSLPKSNRGNYARATFSTKSVYATCEIDRRSIKQSLNQGAFVEGLKEVTKKTVEANMRNTSRILFGDGTGALGTIATSGVSGSAPTWVLTISDATWKVANFEVRDFVNIGTGSTDLFEITVVAPLTKAITVVRISGSATPVDADVIFMQGSENNDPQGLNGVVRATSGSKYGINVQYRWQATQVDADGAGLTTDLMNECVLGVDKLFGAPPNLGVTSHVQMRKLLNQLEDQKRYPLEPRATNLKGKISFNAIEFMSTAGAIPIIVDRFARDDSFYFVNDEHIEICHAPDFGWFNDDGTVFLRKADDDSYGARYGGYWEAYIPPTPHGVIFDLSV